MSKKLTDIINENSKKIQIPALALIIGLNVSCGGGGSDKNNNDNNSQNKYGESYKQEVSSQSIYEVDNSQNCEAIFYKKVYPDERFDNKQIPYPIESVNLKRFEDTNYLDKDLLISPGIYDVQINCGNTNSYDELKISARDNKLTLRK